MRESTSALTGPVATRSTYLGLFLVTLSTLAFQILLTRIFSVTIWYHFAFLTVSIAMLGMTIGAITVYLFPRVFTEERAHVHLARSAFVFALTIALSVLVHLEVPVKMDATVDSIVSIIFTCLLITIPFTASGICVALALTKFSRQVSTLYAADLAGAALGCVSLVALFWVTDGPTAVFAVAFLANLGAVLFAWRAESPVLSRWVAGSAILLALFVIGHTVLVHQQNAFLRVKWGINTKGQLVETERPIYERWNSHSRIRVQGNAEKPTRPWGWSMSPKLPRSASAHQLYVDIDTGAMTVMTGFDGSLEPLDYLRYDITNLANALRTQSDVLIVGAGGGRDLLSALVFDQSSIVGVEINANILHVVHDVFGDFSGHLDQHPKITLINDEARSYVARSPDLYDIIQISLIDSWAATAAGAFVLTEHSLYTMEAWEIFLDHLKPNGILTLSCYYYPAMPGSAYRLVSLAVAALEEQGVQDPRRHIAMVRAPYTPSSPLTHVTILVGKDPFSRQDLNLLENITDEMQFIPVLVPDFAEDGVFETLTSGEDLSDFYEDFPLNLTPSTDDNPFFFHMMRFRDIFSSDLWEDQGFVNFNIRAVMILGTLLVTVSLLTFFFVILPLIVRSRVSSGRDVLPFLLHFGGIGTGFMMIEISQVERLIVFLGHPVYSLTVVLFTLLLASGLGSFSTQSVELGNLRRAAVGRMGALVLVLILFGFLTPTLTQLMQDASTPIRILTSVCILAPIGFMMGMAFPLGMKAASHVPGGQELAPWLWGINGATGVLASVLAIVVSMSVGVSAAFWTGVVAYLAATAGLFWIVRNRVSFG